jgi:hypothetical protein
MAKLSIVAGATSQSVNIFVQNSSSTTGAGLTGLVFNSTGLIAYYTFAGANAGSVQITLATLAAANSAYSSGGFKEIDSTNMPGIYRLDLPNATIAASKGRSVLVYLQGVTNMAPCVLEIELTGVDNQDAVHFGLSSLPNAAAASAGGLPTVGTGASQIDVDASGRVNIGKWLGTLVTAATAGIPDVNAKNINNVAAATDANNLLKVDVEDVLGASTLSELTQAQPPTNPTLSQALMALYMALRNNLTTTASTKSIFNNAGTVIFKKALSDDGTTYTETKAVSGP